MNECRAIFSFSRLSLSRKNQSIRSNLVVKIMIVFIHRLDNHVMNQQLHFHPAVMHDKALNRVVHDQHHWQNQNTDDLKHAGFEFQSAATNRLNKWLNQHHGSNQPPQLKKHRRFPTGRNNSPHKALERHRRATAWHSTPHVVVMNPKGGG